MVCIVLKPSYVATSQLFQICIEENSMHAFAYFEASKYPSILYLIDIRIKQQLYLTQSEWPILTK